MKRFLALTLAIVLCFSAIPMVSAADTDTDLVSSTRTDFEDGSYMVREVRQTVSKARASTTSGAAIEIYYDSTGTKIFGVAVDGTFTYDGSTATANSSSCVVYIFDDSATYVSKSTYTSGDTAYGVGTVKYLSKNRSLTVTLTCDKNGNLF